MIKKFLFLTIPFVLSAEPSAFDAGNLDLEQPYGLTQSEKITLQNRDNIKSINVKVNSISRKVEQNSEKIKGLLSVVDGSNKGMHDKLIELQKGLTQLQTQNSQIQNQVQTLSQDYNASTKRYNLAITELSDIVNNINKKYVDRNRFRKLEEAFFELEKAVTSGNSQFGEDNWSVYKDMLDYYKKQEYDEVQKRASYLIKQNYKKATASFYLGEVYFIKKNYEDAIFYFKESWSLYGESEFMPVLLLHSAMSLEKLGQESEANTFYQSLIDSYPKTKEAQEAQEKLKGK